MRETPIALVAMGGHAFIREGNPGTIEEHERNAAYIARALMYVVERDYHMVVTHGNGPQVGNLLIQQEMARGEVPEMPLDVLVAMTEGSLGYILQQSLLNELKKRDIPRFVVTMVTQVFVDDNDPAFREPSKPVGPSLSREEAERRRDELGWKVEETTSGGGWRRIVASPKPIRVLQRDMVRQMVSAGHIVVTCGGGGIPIKVDPKGGFVGVEAVVDKDLTSSVLAANVGAEMLIFLTSVPQVYVHYGTENQRPLGAVTLDELERLHAEGHFPPGSMGPKIDAVIHFLKEGGRRALITDPRNLAQAIEGRGGTHFIGKI